MLKYLKDYVELKTKVASVLPFFYTLLLYLLLGASGFGFKPMIAIMFFISMICLDMATTCLNHFVGMEKETDISKYDSDLQVQMKQLGVGRTFNLVVMGLLTSIGVILGLIIAFNSSWQLIVIGGLCVLVAIAYSFGPIPLKNTCLGEVASSITMGFFIPLAFVTSQAPQLLFAITGNVLLVNLKALVVLVICLSIPIILIANIMLANNICDVEKDENNRRYTLVVHIGRQLSIKLWTLGYILCYVMIVIAVGLSIFPIVSLLAFITVIPVMKNIKQFAANPVKQITFIMAIKNIVMIMLALTVTFAIGLIL